MFNKMLLAGFFFVAAASVAAATPPGGQPGSGTNPGGQENGHVKVTMTVTGEAMIYMGMSDKLAPNERAAASQGTRTEVEVYKVDVEGPKGQVDGYVAGEKDKCAQCTISDPYDQDVIVLDAPGRN